jgi:hypothetical protein
MSSLLVWRSLVVWMSGSIAIPIAGCGFQSTAKPGEDAGIDGPPPVIDAAIDTPIDMPAATGCVGAGDWQVCLGTAPPGPKTLDGTLNTDTSDRCLANIPPGWGGLQADACFIVADTITVGSLRAVGSRALVLAAATRLTVTTLLDVSSKRGDRGAGSQSTECKAFGREPSSGNAQPPEHGGGGGGAGGSFMTQAGNGGTGDDGVHQNGLVSDPDFGAPMRLRGGCAGQPGGGAGSSSAGPGGGAVYLLSGGTLVLTGVINASGGGGAGGSSQPSNAGGRGGGGGGSGGAIFLYGAPITTAATTVLLANGGSGGGGGAEGGPTADGSDGHEPLVTAPSTPAVGGAAGLESPNGSGGAGGDGYPATNVAPNDHLNAKNGDVGGGGGGGGGGAGYIQANQDLTGATASPHVTMH